MTKALSCEHTTPLPERELFSTPVKQQWWTQPLSLSNDDRSKLLLLNKQQVGQPLRWPACHVYVLHDTGTGGIHREGDRKHPPSPDLLPTHLGGPGNPRLPGFKFPGSNIWRGGSGYRPQAPPTGMDIIIPATMPTKGGAESTSLGKVFTASARPQWPLRSTHCRFPWHGLRT